MTIARSARKSAKPPAPAKPAPPTPADEPKITRWEREDPDVQLMLAFQKGDQAAFEQLVERNTPKVHALIYRFLGEPGLVEDLTQEVFMRIFRTASRYVPAAKFSTWLYRIVANLAFNVLRDRKKGREVQLTAAGSDDPEALYRNVPDTQQVSPEHGLDSGELGAHVAEAIASLPENQRIAILLNRYEDKRYEEIAKVLNCSTMAVKSLLSRARGNLKESLRRYLKID